MPSWPRKSVEAKGTREGKTKSHSWGVFHRHTNMRIRLRVSLEASDILKSASDTL